VAERGRGKSRVCDGILSDVRSSGKEGPTHVGSVDRRSNRNMPLTCGPGPLNNFSNFQTPLKLLNSERKPSRAPNILKLCMWLDLNILNNFLDSDDFKFSIEFML
jgi:hypothetical protein